MENPHEIFKQFNELYEKYCETKSQENINALNRSLAIISTILDSTLFNPSNTETCLFYIHLHDLIGNIDSQSSLLLACCAALEHALNYSVRESLVDKFKYLPVITKILEEINEKHKILQVLNILKSLTYNIKLTWNEPYLQKLIRALVKLILIDKGEVVHLATVVLINLCFKNASATECLRKEKDHLEVMDKIMSHTILHFKLQYILFDPGNAGFNLDIQSFVRYIFHEISTALIKWDLNLIIQTVDFFIDLKIDYPNYLKEYSNYAAQMDGLILTLNEQINKKEVENDQKSFVGETQLLTIQKLLVWFENLMDFDNCSCSLKLLNFALKWTNDDLVSKEAYNILSKIIQSPGALNDNMIQQTLIEKLPDIFLMMEKLDFNIDTTSSLFKLFHGLLQNDAFKERVLETVKIESFKVFISQLTKYSTYQIISMPETELIMNLLGIKLVYSFSQSLANMWKYQFDNLLEMQNTQMILVKALFLSDAKLIQFVLELIKCENCSIENAADLIATHELNYKNHKLDLCQMGKSKVIYLPESQNKFLESRIEDAIDRILGARNLDELNSASVNDVIDLFEFKITTCNNNELYLLKQLDEAANAITLLSQQNVLLESEISRLRDNHTKYKLEQKQKKIEKSLIVKEIAEKSIEIAAMRVMIRKKEQEYDELFTKHKNFKREMSKLKCGFDSKLDVISLKDKELMEFKAEYEKQQEVSKHICARIIELEAAIEGLKQDINEKNHEIEDAEAEIKAVEIENTSLKGIIDELNGTITDKDLIISEYENEMKEIQNMKERVIEIVKAKKAREQEQQQKGKSKESNTSEPKEQNDGSDWD